MIPDPTECSVTNDAIILKDYSASVKYVDCKSHFVKYQTPSGRTKVLEKTTFLWLMYKDSGKLSSDRLRRVKQADSINPFEESLFFQETPPNIIYRDDRCIFKMENEDRHLVGHILDFVYFGKIQEIESAKFNKSHVDQVRIIKSRQN